MDDRETAVSWYSCPDTWSDHAWLASSGEFRGNFEDTAVPAMIDLSRCEWIDLHPLTDLHVKIERFIRQGGKVQLRFENVRSRGLRFLRDCPARC